MIVSAVFRPRTFDDGEAEELIAIFGHRQDAEAFAEPYTGYYVADWEVDEPDYIEQVRTGLRPWFVILWPMETGEHDAAFLWEPNDDPEPMRATDRGSFTGTVLAKDADEAMAAGWEDVKKRGLVAKPYAPPLKRAFVDFAQYLDQTETPFAGIVSKQPPKQEWGVDESDNT